MIKLSAFRYAPVSLKPSFWMESADFETVVEDDDIVKNDDVLFYKRLLENGLTVQNEKNNYLYLHLNGSHAPYHMDENGKWVDESDVIQQTKGCFNILFAYMDEMKKLGLYKDATIVILGDHGWDTNKIGFFVKPRGSADMPLTQNNAPISTHNLLPTLLKSEGFEYSAYGVPVFDVEQNTNGERLMIRYARTGESVRYYKIVGDPDIPENLELISERDFLVDLNGGLPVN